MDRWSGVCNPGPVNPECSSAARLRRAMMSLERAGYLFAAVILVASCMAMWWLFLGVCKCIRRRTKVAVLLVILSIPFLPYARVEVQTLLWGASVTPAVRDAMRDLRDGMFPDDIGTGSYMGTKLCYLKVTSVGPGRAWVYIVTYLPPNEEYQGSQPGYSGFCLPLHHRRGRWRYEGGSGSFWTDFGNAHGGTFPPYPARGDFR